MLPLGGVALIVPGAALAHIVTVPPLVGAAGKAFTVTAIVVAVELIQPAPGYVTVKLYTPLAVVTEAVNDGAELVEEKLLVPVQL